MRNKNESYINIIYIKINSNEINNFHKILFFNNIIFNMPI